jgi:hypothetical protein
MYPNQCSGSLTVHLRAWMKSAHLAGARTPIALPTLYRTGANPFPPTLSTDQAMLSHSRAAKGLDLEQIPTRGLIHKAGSVIRQQQPCILQLTHDLFDPPHVRLVIAVALFQ